MRKHALSGLFLAAALGLSLYSGASQVLAEDGAELFPPEMLAPVAAPAKAPAAGSAAAADTGPAAASAEVSAVGAAAPVIVASSTALAAVVRSPISLEDAAPQKSVIASQRAQARDVALRRHVRHAQRARLVPAAQPPVRTVILPLPVVRIAQSGCSGFCGKYVLVGVGF